MNDTEMTMPTHFETFLQAVGTIEDREGILGGDYLVCPPKPDYGYDATPRNALTFATMGVDGVHFAVLTTDGIAGDDSPVIQICPMDFDQEYAVLAVSFLDYLATGCGVSAVEMASVLDSERTSGNRLVPFMRGRFRHSRMLGDKRTQALAHHLQWVERKG